MLAGVATAIPVTLIAPKVSYFLPLLFVLFAGTLKWLSIILENEPKRVRNSANLVAILLALMFFTVRSPFDANVNSPKPQRLEVTEIKTILETQKARPVRVLQGDTLAYGYTAFLPYGLSELVDPRSRRASDLLRNFLNRQLVGAVFLDSSLSPARPSFYGGP